MKDNENDNALQYPLPSEKLLLNALNRVNGGVEQLFEFYDRTANKINYYSSRKRRNGSYYVDEDLRQEVSLYFLKAITPLKKKVLSKFFGR